MIFQLENIVRKNIRELIPYSSAREEYKGKAHVLLDANENAYGSPLPTHYNRYPDPFQEKLRKKISAVSGVAIENIFLGNGSDEIIDILYRICCEPREDAVILYPPTFGVFEVAAKIHGARVIQVPLKKNFQLNISQILPQLPLAKLTFICSPNNPTGNCMQSADVKKILKSFNGIVVVDEAYIHFSEQKSFLHLLPQYPNLVVMQTLSKAWGMAGLRIGIAFASQAIVSIMQKVKPPYNISEVSQQLALRALNRTHRVTHWIKQIKKERDKLIQKLQEFSFIIKVFPSEANFLLIKTTGAQQLYQYLLRHGIVVRNRSHMPGCAECLRITIGTPQENTYLIKILKQYEKNISNP